MKRLICVLVAAQVACAGASGLTTHRAATIAAVGQYFEAHPRLTQQCGPGDGEAKTSRMAFPVGSAARMYQQSGGRIYAFKVQGGHVRLAWCGSGTAPVAQPLPVMLAAAFRVPVQYVIGRATPEYAGLDVYTAFNAGLTVSRVDALGRRVCERTHVMPNASLTLPSVDNLNYGCR